MGRIKKGEDWPELTEENFSIGEKNGINRANVRQRFVDYGWTIERAITEPLKQPKGIWIEWKEVCKQNGVSNELFNRRLVKMSPKEAATMPVGKRGGNSKSLWKDYQEQAEAAGIKQDTFYRRVRKGATPEDAATIPVGKWGKKDV